MSTVRIPAEGHIEEVDFDEQFGKDVTWETVPCPGLGVRGLTMYADEDGKAKSLPTNHMASALHGAEVVGDVLVRSTDEHPMNWVIQQMTEAAGDLPEIENGTALMVAGAEGYEFTIGVNMEHPGIRSLIEQDRLDEWLGRTFILAQNAIDHGVPPEILSTLAGGAIVILPPGVGRGSVRFEGGEIHLTTIEEQMQQQRDE